ncbi:hypothetical protein [Herbaspirillum sp. ST 5-3]|uniref:hypothetical protein n=1 Tax=Oxalobacteraceae TaxID=75682 RepID=UPI0010A5596F|nr:hypothetical protein [Herbaspirillum sp. ST 5-3]
MTIQFSDLDALQKRMIHRLAGEAEAITSTITASAKNPGELWEAVAFFRHHQRGTTEHAQLAARLRMGRTSSESILDAIQRISPDYRTLGQRILDDAHSPAENDVANR